MVCRHPAANLQLGYIEIDDKFDKIARKHGARKSDAVRDAVGKAIVSRADSSWHSWRNDIAALPEHIIKPLLAPIGIDFDALKGEVHETVKEPAILGAVGQDQPR